MTRLVRLLDNHAAGVANTLASGAAVLLFGMAVVLVCGGLPT